jgi:hypothetical protein
MDRMKRLAAQMGTGFLVLVLCAEVFASPKERPKKITAESVMQDIRSLGATATVRKLRGGPPSRRWDLVLRQIGSGSSEWLVVAKALSRDADPETASDLRVTLAKVLPKNPAGVLKLIDGNLIAIENVCTAPFAERDPAFLKRYLRDTQRALKSLNQKDVEQNRVQCLRKIEETIQIEKALRDKLPDPAAGASEEKKETSKKEGGEDASKKAGK